MYICPTCYWVNVGVCCCMGFGKDALLGVIVTVCVGVESIPSGARLSTVGVDVGVGVGVTKMGILPPVPLSRMSGRKTLIGGVTGIAAARIGNKPPVPPPVSPVH